MDIEETAESKTRYFVYKIECFGMYYFGFTSDFTSRIKVHLSVISNSLLKGECKSTIPFNRDVFDYCVKNNIGYRKLKDNYIAIMLKNFKSKVWALRYEEHFIETHVEDTNCKNVFVFNACKAKGRDCITSIFIDGKEEQSNFCVKCGHTIK